LFGLLGTGGGGLALEFCSLPSVLKLLPCCGGTGSRILAFFSAVELLCDSDPNKSCFASLPSKCGVEMALLLGTKEGL
jgi:hypothetical protein